MNQIDKFHTIMQTYINTWSETCDESVIMIQTIFEFSHIEMIILISNDALENQRHDMMKII